MLMKYLAAILPRKTTELEHVEGLNDAPLMAFMSARVGSISGNQRSGWYSYQASKAGFEPAGEDFGYLFAAAGGDEGDECGAASGDCEDGSESRILEEHPER